MAHNEIAKHASDKYKISIHILIRKKNDKGKHTVNFVSCDEMILKKSAIKVYFVDHLRLYRIIISELFSTKNLKVFF